MTIFNFPIKRPITVLMGMLMILIVGLISLDRLPLNLMPDISFPNLSVIITYEGAGPEEVEERVGKILEMAIKTTANIKKVKVTAEEGACIVTAEFNWGTDLDQASADVREKIAMVRDLLPSDISEPVVFRINLQEMPVLFIHVDDNTGRRNLLELAEIARDEVGPRLERLEGVAGVYVLGGLTREIQVNCDREKLKKYRLSLNDVVNAIRYQSLDLTTGHVDHVNMRFRIKGKGQFQSIDDIENVILGYGLTEADQQKMLLSQLVPYKDPLAGRGAVAPIRVKDVAEVIDTFKERRGLIRIIQPHTGPREGVGMAVMKETDANMVEVSRHCIKEIERMGKVLPAGVEVSVSFDFSELITDSINALARSAVEGGILAMIVIFIFLWEIRPSLIILTSIPLSLLAAFIAMYFSDFTLNIMTLGGMVIAVGKLVDDSIVVLENTVRHLHMGEHPHTAAEKGFREVAVAVTAATLVAVIIFLPVAFTQGLSAQLFRTFAATILYALMGSLLVAFTVIPMLSSRLLRLESEEELRKRRGLIGSFKRFIAYFRRGHNRIWSGIENVYRRILTWSVDNYGKVFLLTILVLMLTGVLLADIVVSGKYEFVPKLVGNIYRAVLKLPSGAIMQETDKEVARITERLVKGIPDWRSIFLIVGESGDPGQAAFMGETQSMNTAEFNLRTYKEVERKKLGIKEKSTEDQIRAIWDEFAQENPNLEISFMSAGSLKFTMEKAIVIRILGNDFAQLRKISDDIAAEVKKIPGTRDVSTSMESGVPEYNYVFDRDRLGLYYLPAGLVLAQTRTGWGGMLATLYREAGKEYDITVRLREDQRKDFQDVGDTPLMSPLGQAVPLREVAEFQWEEGPLKIKRDDSRRVVTVEANKTEEASLGELSKKIQNVIDRYPLPEGYMIEFGGEVEDLREAFTDLGIMFAAAIILVYLILASLYESLIHPLTIMSAIPLAFIGSLGALYITNTNFGVTAFIGMIMLVGIVATNSIVMVDFILEFHRGRQMPRREAIIAAGQTRLRPILMTALTTLFGVIPIALGRAEGMELQQPLGIVMVGGLFSSTALSLIIVPVFYLLFDDLIFDLQRLFGRKTAEPSSTPPSPPA